MKKTLSLTAALIAISANAVFAQSLEEQITVQLQTRNFQNIEIQTGPTQIKAEGFDGNRKVEIIYDRATGRILKQETKRLRFGEDQAQGVVSRVRSEDFLGDDDNSQDDHGGLSSDDDSDDDSGRGDDRSDDRGDDDHGSGSHGSNDDGQDDDGQDDDGHDDDSNDDDSNDD